MSSCCAYQRSSKSVAPPEWRRTVPALVHLDPRKTPDRILRRARGILAALWASLILAAIGTVVPALATESVEYTLGAGDEVRVTVFGQTDLSGKFTVDGGGAISMPLIGNVDAGGKTVREATNAIVAKLKPDYLKNPRVSVEVLNYRPFYILGEVKRPGSYPYVSGMTAVNAVALGGGYTYRARENNIYITRGKDPKREKKKASHDTIVLPGDILEVPERFF